MNFISSSISFALELLKQTLMAFISPFLAIINIFNIFGYIGNSEIEFKEPDLPFVLSRERIL